MWQKGRKEGRKEGRKKGRITLAAARTDSRRARMEAAGCNSPAAMRAAWIEMAGLEQVRAVRFWLYF